MEYGFVAGPIEMVMARIQEMAAEGWFVHTWHLVGPDSDGKPVYSALIQRPIKVSDPVQAPRKPIGIGRS